jgi:hypothetical protein
MSSKNNSSDILLTISADDARVAYPLFQEEYGGANPTSALQLNITRIATNTAVLLNKLWHSRLPNIGNDFCCFAYGAEYSNKYYAVALWSNPVAANRLKDGDRILELRRMAISPDAPKNTASRMLRIMRMDIVKTRPDIIRLISYQDTEVHTGTIYKASGWIARGYSEGMSWSNKYMVRNKEQTLAPKVRWEYDLI